MLLEGSCHCKAVSFSLEADCPLPFLRCYCSICRKTAGGGGFAVNLGGSADTLQVQGREATRVYHARLGSQRSEGERHFCGECGSALWAWDPRWPELVHPFASAIDTPLPEPPEHSHMMLGSKAGWVEPAVVDGDRCFDEYPDESLAEWHQRVGFTD